MRNVLLAARLARSFVLSVEPYLAIHAGGVMHRIVEVSEEIVHVILYSLLFYPLDFVAELKLRGSQAIVP